MDTFSEPLVAERVGELPSLRKQYLADNPEIEEVDRVWQIGAGFVVLHIIYTKPLNRVT